MKKESEFIPLRSNIISESDKREQQYQNDLEEFLIKNPRGNEEFYINYKIEVFEKLIIENKETADFGAGEYLDGTDLINDNLLITQTGTAGDYFDIEEVLNFLLNKKESLKNPFIETKEKQTIELKDFFKHTTPMQLDKITSTFNKLKGKDLARVIYFLIQKEKLNLTKSSADFGLSSFLKLFAGIENIEAVRKHFDSTSLISFVLTDKNNLQETGIEEKINSIYKVV